MNRRKPLPPEPDRSEDEMARRDPQHANSDHQKRAGRALAAYRERRRRRRAEDTYFGSAECLIQHVEEGLAEAERSNRLNEIVRDAEREGISRDLAERLYEVAREEGIDPALGFELVRCGLGVAPPPEGISTAAEAPSTDKYLPEWMFPAIPPDTLLRERMLRFSFRRLRTLLEQYDDLDEVFTAFAKEPDVGVYGY
jgi:hypothetical protein